MAAQGRSVGLRNTATPCFLFQLTDEAKVQRGHRASSGSHSSLLVGLGCKPSSRVCTFNQPEIWPRAPAEQQNEKASLHQC